MFGHEKSRQHLENKTSLGLFLTFIKQLTYIICYLSEALQTRIVYKSFVVANGANGMYSTRFKNKGLSIIELVVVIVIIAILAVTAGPVFFGRKGVDEFLFQARLYSVLRLQQQKAMQDIANCYGVIVQSNRFAATADCNTTVIADPLAGAGLGISQGEASEAALIITSSAASLPYTIIFNALGCPVISPSTCDDGINHELSIVGTTTLQICVNSQGYLSKGACL